MTLETAHGKATKEQLYLAFGVSRQAVHQARRVRRKAPKATFTCLPFVFPGLTGAWGPAAWLAATTRFAGRCVPAAILKPAIRAVVKEHPAWGVRKVWAVLRRQGYRASQKRIYALMRSMNLTLPAHPRAGEATRGHVAVPNSNRRWGTDLTTAWTRLDGWVAIVPVLGLWRSLPVGLCGHEEPGCFARSGPGAAGTRKSISHPRNVPDGLEMRTDHGPQYTGEDCVELMRGWSVNHTFAPIGRPTGNSVVERFILTLKTELIWTRDWESREDLEAALRAWANLYNHERPHQALGWLTPAECRDQHLNQPADRHIHVAARAA